MIFDYSVIAVLAIIIGGLTVGMKWYLQYREKTQRQIIREEREMQKPENQIDALIQNLPAILKDRQDLYEKAVLESGADSPLAKSLKQQIDIMKLVASVPEPVLNIAKPILLKGIAMISKFRL
jgi:hypothetical protein